MSGWIVLIPARGGSKGIPGKNLRELGGIPLVARTIRKARLSKAQERLLVSTDAEALAHLARLEGAEVPFLRPADLALDQTPMGAVVAHAWNFVKNLAAPERSWKGLILLQPTSPFLKSATIDQAVQAIESSQAPVLKAVRQVRDHPAWMVRRRGPFLEPYLQGTPPRRQDLEELWIPCGAIYIYRSEYLDRPVEHPKTAWIKLEWPESLDLDEPEDWQLAESVIAAGLAGDGLPRP